MKNLEIINKTRTKIDKNLFKKTAKIVLKNKKKVTLIFTDDQEIKKLNRKYRKKNKTTEILAFPAISKAKDLKECILPESERDYLGEIVISIEQAQKQANLFGYSRNKELIRLFIHGLLHLLGYEHRRKKERKKMEKLEMKLLKKLSKRDFA